MHKEGSLPQVTARDLEEKITSGLLSGQLPAVTELAKTLGISPVSARQALHLLKEKGLVEIRQGVGTKVVGTKVVSLNFAESPSSPKDLAILALKQESLNRDQLFAIGLHLFTQRRIAEVAYQENPNPASLQTFITTAGRETVFAHLLSEPGDVGEGMSGAGIRRMFAPEIRAFEQAPTIGDALASIVS